MCQDGTTKNYNGTKGSKIHEEEERFGQDECREYSQQNRTVQKQIKEHIRSHNTETIKTVAEKTKNMRIKIDR